MKKNEILRIKTKDIRKGTRCILNASGLSALILEKTGGFRGETKIMIKPNLVCPSPAEFGATTHVEIVEELIAYLFESGFRNITVAEGSWVGDRTEEAFDLCGYRRIAGQYGVKLLDTKKEKSKAVSCAGMDLEICSCALETDFLINVPVLKGHCQTKMTCALKNMKGLIPDSEKRRFHKMGLHDPIAHLNTGIRQDFILVDDICGDPDFEEGGNPGAHSSILAAEDPVLMDAYACHVLGWTPEDVPYLIRAQELGVGSMEGGIVTDLDTESTEVMESAGISIASREDKAAGDIHEASAPLTAEDTGRRRLDVSYAVEDADTCSACYSSLTEAMWRLNEEGLLDKLSTRIGLGQGMRGKSGKLGIGNCTSGFDTFVKGCPPGPDEIYESLKAFISAGDPPQSSERRSETQDLNK